MNKRIDITAEELDEKIEDGEDVSAYFDDAPVMRPNLEMKRLMCDIPMWVVQQLDREAALIGVSRQSVLRQKLAQALLSEKEMRAS